MRWDRSLAFTKCQQPGHFSSIVSAYVDVNGEVTIPPFQFELTSHARNYVAEMSRLIFHHKNTVVCVYPPCAWKHSVKEAVPCQRLLLSCLSAWQLLV